MRMVHQGLPRPERRRWHVRVGHRMPSEPERRVFPGGWKARSTRTPRRRSPRKRASRCARHRVPGLRCRPRAPLEPLRGALPGPPCQGAGRRPPRSQADAHPSPTSRAPLAPEPSPPGWRSTPNRRPRRRRSSPAAGQRSPPGSPPGSPPESPSQPQGPLRGPRGRRVARALGARPAGCRPAPDRDGPRGVGIRCDGPSGRRSIRSCGLVSRSSRPGSGSGPPPRVREQDARICAPLRPSGGIEARLDR